MSQMSEAREELGEVAARDTQAPFVLALDIGTSSVRASIYDGRARAIEATQARIERSFCTTADGGAQLSADESVAEVARVVEETLGRGGAEVAARVEAVAVSCFWHSLVGVGAQGEALTPVLGWADTRAGAEVSELRGMTDERAAHARTGCRFHPSYWPTKLLWLRRTSPEITRDVRRWLSFAEFLALRFAGDASRAVDAGAGVAASVSMASGTGLFNQRACIWDEALLADLRLPIEQLPQVSKGTASLFYLGGEYAARWPSLRGRPWLAAVGDGAANNVGAGCTTRESAALMVGTSGALRVLYEGDAPASLPASLWCYRADERRVVVGGALSDGGGLFQWMRTALALSGGGDDEAWIERALAEIEPDAHGLTLLPFWAGERSTGWHAEASGAILGLTTHTRPLDILRAALEAVAYRFALVAEALDSLAPAPRLRASGGALRASPAWVQILSDVLGRPVELQRVREASSRGAVLLALEALGAIKSIHDVPTPPAQIYEPDAARQRIYRAGLERQQKFYELLVGQHAPHADAHVKEDLRCQSE